MARKHPPGVLESTPEAALEKDQLGNCPLHKLYSNESVSAQLVRILVDCAPEATTELNVAGKTPLHTLCESRHVTVEILAAFLDRSPAAAKRATSEAFWRGPGLLPLHLLCENQNIGGDALRAAATEDGAAAVAAFADSPADVTETGSEAEISQSVPENASVSSSSGGDAALDTMGNGASAGAAGDTIDSPSRVAPSAEALQINDMFPELPIAAIEAALEELSQDAVIEAALEGKIDPRGVPSDGRAVERIEFDDENSFQAPPPKSPRLYGTTSHTT